jgi:hypothetical protein
VDIITTDDQDIHAVELVGLCPSEEVDEMGLDFTLCLYSRGGDALVVELMLTRGGGTKPAEIFLELEDCVTATSIPKAAVDSEILLEWYRDRGPEGFYDLLMSSLGARASTLKVQAGKHSVRFTLCIGNKYRSELLVPLKTIAGFLEPT